MTPGEPLVRWDWVASHATDIGQRIGEHLELTVIAVAIGFVIAFVLSLLALRVPRLYGPITWTTGILYTIPSLALFALLIPYTGLSLLSAEIGAFAACPLRSARPRAAWATPSARSCGASSCRSRSR